MLWMFQYQLGTRQALSLQVLFFSFPLTEENTRLLLLYRMSSTFSARCQQRVLAAMKAISTPGCVCGTTASRQRRAMHSPFTHRSLDHI